MDIKPKETYYRGIKYRSRIEARWSVLFDVLWIEKQYEPEKFDLGDGIVYIPDFFLPKLGGRHGIGVYFEVKGACPDEEDIVKAARLSRGSHRDAVIFDGSDFDSGRYCIGMFGNIHTATCEIMQCPFCGAFEFTNTKRPITQDEFNKHGFPSIFSHTCQPRVAFAKRYDIDKYFMDFSEVETLDSTDILPITNHSPCLDIAYGLAKSARFEDPSFETQVQATTTCISRLMSANVFGMPEVYLYIADLARKLNLNPDCPRFYYPEVIA